MRKNGRLNWSSHARGPVESKYAKGNTQRNRAVGSITLIRPGWAAINRFHANVRDLPKLPQSKKVGEESIRKQIAAVDRIRSGEGGHWGQGI